jgi:hypothetical protein
MNDDYQYGILLPDREIRVRAIPARNMTPLTPLTALIVAMPEEKLEIIEWQETLVNPIDQNSKQNEAWRDIHGIALGMADTQ